MTADAFADVVWDALEGDHSDLRKQAIILRAYRESGLAEACALYDDAIDMMFDGPDESDEGYAKSRWKAARGLFAAAQGIETAEAAKTEGLGPKDESPTPEGGCAR